MTKLYFVQKMNIWKNSIVWKTNNDNEEWVLLDQVAISSHLVIIFLECVPNTAQSPELPDKNNQNDNSIDFVNQMGSWKPVLGTSSFFRSLAIFSVSSLTLSQVTRCGYTVQQHPAYLSSNYYPVQKLLDFGDQMGTGMFNVARRRWQ
jgi:hypothetical protein